MELTPGEQKMLGHAAENALELSSLLTDPVSVQDVHDAEKLAKQVLASIQYLKGRLTENAKAVQQHRPTTRPGHD